MDAGVSYGLRPLPRGPVSVPVSVEDLFGLREDPFSLTPNPRFLHRTRHAHDTLGQLTRGILDRKGLILLSGEVGTGKTTLLYTALHLMNLNPAVQNKIGTAVIVHPTLTRDEFLETVLDEFEVPCSSTRRQPRLEALLKMLLQVRRKRGVAVLVVDEAHLLTVGLLDEIRSLLNLQTSHDRLLQIVLCGQPEIETKLARMNVNLRPNEPFVAVRCNTAPLSLKDTHEYIQHRLRIAGANDDAIFSPDAVEAIQRQTNGVPRLVNLLCAHALSAAAMQRSSRIYPSAVAEAAAWICSGALTADPVPVRVAVAALDRVAPLPGLAGRAEARLMGNFSDADTAHPDLPPAGVAPADHPATNRATPESGTIDLVTSEAAPSGRATDGDAFEKAAANASPASAVAVGEPDAEVAAATPSSEVAVAGSASPKVFAPLEGAAAAIAARKQERAARHRAKLARRAKAARGNTRPVGKGERHQQAAPQSAPPVARIRQLRSVRDITIANIAASLPSWNGRLDRWCSEHFTSKGCGRVLFQLGLAGTLFLALAQVVGFGSPEQHVAHVAFGFLGMIFIDISLGLGTYLLVLERGLPPASRAGWAQILVGSWWILRRRME
jgi:general secretion pathway protein A